MANQVAAKQNDLAVDDEWEARAGQPNRGPEAVPVNHGVQQRRQQNRENLKRLRKLEPEEAHEDQDRVVEETKESEFPSTEDSEECAEEVEETREVENVGPEEHAPAGARAQREAQEPLKRRRRPRPPPEPARVSDLRRRGKENAGENDGGDQRHGEAVDGRDWAEWQRTAAFDQQQYEVEGGGEYDVGGDCCNDE